jgi:hypothetical protein
MAHWSRIRAVLRSCFLIPKMAGFEALNFDLQWLGLTDR